MADEERQPLLKQLLPDGSASQTAKPDHASNAQIIILCAARAVETGVYNMVFPIIPDLVSRSGVQEADLGLYCGIIESSFAIAQCIAVLFWGRLSDKRGRKPVLCACLLGTAIGVTLFGFATKIWQMVLIRAILGIFAASELTIRVMIGESSDNSPQAYAYLSVAGNLAQVITPVLAGASYEISKDKLRFPALFPCALIGGVAFLVALTVALTVRETSQAKRETAAGNTTPSYREVFQAPTVMSAFLVSSLNFTLLLSLNALGPTYMYTSVKQGGWSFSSGQIAGYLGWQAFWATCWAAFGFSAFYARFGTERSLNMVSWPAPLMLIWWIVSNAFLRRGYSVVFWIILPFVPPLHPVIFATTQIIFQITFNKLAPTNGISAVNALLWAITGAQRAAIPALANSGFALTVRKQLVHGYLVSLLLLGLAVIYCLSVRISAGAIERRLIEKNV